MKAASPGTAISRFFCIFVRKKKKNTMIREVTLHDAAAIAAIYNDYILHTTVSFETEPLTTEAMRDRIAHIAADYPYFVAEENGIVTGYGDGTFGPEDSITREQLAAILYRYASYKGYDVTISADLSSYTDADSVSAYAVDAMSWANAEGLITGVTATTLNPTGTATRAQVATILMRFVENVAK